MDLRWPGLCSSGAPRVATLATSRHSSYAPAVPAAARPRRPRQQWRQAARCELLEPDAAGSGNSFFRGPKKPSKLEPSFWLSREDAVTAQLKALQHNNFPYNDSGIETLYRFAGFDPFHRSSYFGVNLDLGQFERFRRIFYTPYYNTLLNLSDWDVSSTLEVAEGLWIARVHVVNAYRKEERDYTFTMEQRFGGRYDGVWYCKQLLAEGVSAKSLYGVI